VVLHLTVTEACTVSIGIDRVLRHTSGDYTSPNTNAQRANAWRIGCCISRDDHDDTLSSVGPRRCGHGVASYGRDAACWMGGPGNACIGHGIELESFGWRGCWVDRAATVHFT
jgi:hypothetical protein